MPEAPSRFEISERLERDIANYLGKGVRTVQRYEREMGLPIHRPAGMRPRGAAVAIRAELDSWVTTGNSRGDSMPRRRALNRQTNRLGANFLKIDSEIALTFSRIALDTHNEAKKRRAIRVARNAYDSI